jgi:hypothetical protein
MNIQYAIEVKPKGFAVRESLKEVYLQLLGLNVDNSHASPHVLLTDLVDTHYILFLEMINDNPLSFRLCIETSSSLELIIRRCSVLARRACVTRRFGSGPTPPSGSLNGKPLRQVQAYEDEDGDEVTDDFLAQIDSVKVMEVGEEEDNDNDA